MADATATRTFVPLEMWPFIALRLPPLVWGSLVAGVLIVGAVLFRALILSIPIDSTGPPVDIGFATRVALVVSVSIGYSLGVWRWISAAQIRDYVELGIELEYADAGSDYIHRVNREQLRASRIAGVGGVAFFFLLIELPNAIVGSRLLIAWTTLHTMTYMLFLGVVFFWILGRSAYFSVGRSQLRSVLDRLEIDILDQRPLRVFGRIGLRSAFIWVLGGSIGMLAFVNPEIRIRESLVVLVPLMIASMCVTLAALLLPVRGLHARLVAAKAEEIARIEAAIRGDLSALAGSAIAQREPPPSLADLIAYKGLVEAAPTWPLDGSTLGRLGLYLLIPVGSWIGGALMERAVSAVLD